MRPQFPCGAALITIKIWVLQQHGRLGADGLRVRIRDDSKGGRPSTMVLGRLLSRATSLRQWRAQISVREPVASSFSW